MQKKYLENGIINTDIICTYKAQQCTSKGNTLVCQVKRPYKPNKYMYIPLCSYLVCTD